MATPGLSLLMSTGIDMVGFEAGRLEVTAPAPAGKDGKRRWFCRCACGTVDFAVRGISLRRGLTTSCGCVRRETARAAVLGKPGRYAVNLTDERYGRLTVVRRTDRKSGSRWLWECRCACGQKTEATSVQLRGGRKKSCGCSRRSGTRWPRVLPDAIVTAA